MSKIEDTILTTVIKPHHPTLGELTMFEVGAIETCYL